MRAALRLKLQYTEVARSEKDGQPVIAMRQRVKDEDGNKHTTEWVYMELGDAEGLAETLRKVLAADGPAAQQGVSTRP